MGGVPLQADAGGARDYGNYVCRYFGVDDAGAVTHTVNIPVSPSQARVGADSVSFGPDGGPFANGQLSLQDWRADEHSYDWIGAAVYAS